MPSSKKTSSMFCTVPTIASTPYPDVDRYRVNTGIVMTPKDRRSALPSV
jgi:hypothetical protein